MGVHELLIRFTEKANYFLVYGNKTTPRPNYDINHFLDQVPQTLMALELDKERVVVKEEVVVNGPLFKNKAWLWGIMVVIILLLGWFSLIVLRKSS